MYNYDVRCFNSLKNMKILNFINLIVLGTTMNCAYSTENLSYNDQVEIANALGFSSNQFDQIVQENESVMENEEVQQSILDNIKNINEQKYIEDNIDKNNIKKAKEIILPFINEFIGNSKEFQEVKNFNKLLSLISNIEKSSVLYTSFQKSYISNKIEECLSYSKNFSILAGDIEDKMKNLILPDINQAMINFCVNDENLKNRIITIINGLFQKFIEYVNENYAISGNRDFLLENVIKDIKPYLNEMGISESIINIITKIQNGKCDIYENFTEQKEAVKNFISVNKN